MDKDMQAVINEHNKVAELQQAIQQLESVCIHIVCLTYSNIVV
jgi:hypothetical protein